MINYRHYWHKALKDRIGQKVEIGWDERTIQRVYGEIDGHYVQMPVTGRYPDVCASEWEAERARVRTSGKAYQADGARMATARAIVAANREIVDAGAKTKEARNRVKRREGEGLTLADLRTFPVPEPPIIAWKPISELGYDDWLKVRT